MQAKIIKKIKKVIMKKEKASTLNPNRVKVIVMS